MAILKGKDGTVSIAGATVGHVSSWSASLETETLETTSMATSGADAGWKTFVGSLQSWSGSVDMFIEETTSLAAFVTGVDVAVSLVDGASGNVYAGTAIVTSMSVDVGAADLTTVTLDLTGDGELTIT